MNQRSKVIQRFLKALVFALGAVICDRASRSFTGTSLVLLLILIGAALCFGIAAAIQIRLGVVEYREQTAHARNDAP